MAILISLIGRGESSRTASEQCPTKTESRIITFFINSPFLFKQFIKEYYKHILASEEYQKNHAWIAIGKSNNKKRKLESLLDIYVWLSPETLPGSTCRRIWLTVLIHATSYLLPIRVFNEFINIDQNLCLT